jgi:hypothetical protein
MEGELSLELLLTVHYERVLNNGHVHPLVRRREDLE